MGMFDSFIEDLDAQPGVEVPRVASAFEQKMEELLQLILRERDCTRKLDMAALKEVSTAKDALVRELAGLDASSFANARLAARIREENRRNAYLYWAGLNLVRETMGFFGRQVPPPSYGAFGGMVQGRRGGNLLSGRI